MSPVNNVIKDGLNSVIKIIEGLALVNTSLDIVVKLLAKGILATAIWKVHVDWCRISSILFHWSVLESGGKNSSGVVTWSG